MKHSIHITGKLEREEKEEDIENLFEKIMTENCTNLERGKTMQVQEALKVSVKMNPKSPTPN